MSVNQALSPIEPYKNLNANSMNTNYAIMNNSIWTTFNLSNKAVGNLTGVITLTAGDIYEDVFYYNTNAPITVNFPTGASLTTFILNTLGTSPIPFNASFNWKVVNSASVGNTITFVAPADMSLITGNQLAPGQMAIFTFIYNGSNPVWYIV
jgi:hypothetical protein